MTLTISSVGGILAGRNPLEYLPSNPITLFLFQAIFIIAFCQIIHIPLGYIKQPRVIAEVISGILLGPTVFGRIPNFTNTCFPSASIPLLTLVANIGVIFFLFLVGMEVDIKFIKKNIKIASTVGIVNMAIPFGLGCLLAIGLHKEYEPDSKFTTFMVFIAVAMCITAFPVLARILTELRLLKDRVGTIVLAAGITNDIIGWILLALSVTLANSGNGLNTLYTLLIVIGWGLFIIYPIRIILNRLILKKDLENGTLSRFSILIIILLVFVSSFFTDIIGVHPIFGAFLIGVIIPRECGFVIEITNKIEDLTHIIFIPIYFALAGFNVNLGQLNNGTDWGYIIALIVIAVVGKVFGGFISAKFNGLFWRESLAVGVLMSCKGIVEIVVLTVGLNANIISSKVFSMFIVMTLVSTFLTTPLTLLVYPISYREKVAKYLKEEIDWDGNPLEKVITKNSDLTVIHDSFKFEKIIYNIEKVDDYLTLLNFIDLFYGGNFKVPFNVVFLKQLTERTSDLIDASTEDQYHLQLEVLKRIFEYHNIPFNGQLKYYIDNDKFESVEEVSDNVNDFIVFNSNLFDYDTTNHLAIFNKLSRGKITEITVSLDSDLIRHLIAIFYANNPSLKIYILGDGSLDYGSVKRVKNKDDIKGLFLAGLRNPLINDLVNVDVLAVK